MSYLDDAGLAYFWGKIKQTFWSLLSRSSNVSVYVSKTGSDSNDGLSSSTPVLTLERALAVAQNYSTSGEIAFFFGPGEWGSVTIYGSTLRCSSVRVTNFTDSTPTTVSAFNALSGSSEPPHFTSLVLREGVFTVGAIYVDDFNVRNFYNNDSNVFFSFGRLVLHKSYFALANAIVNSNSTGTNVIYLISSRLNCFNGTIHFDSITKDTFIAAGYSSTIRINNDVTFSGSFTGSKFDFFSMVTLPHNSISPFDFPGTSDGIGNFSYANLYYSSNEGLSNRFIIKSIITDISSTSRASNYVGRFAFYDKNDKIAGSLEVGFQTTGGRYICLQGRNRADDGWLDGYRVTEAVDGTITHTVGSSPAANADNKEIATTEWVIDKIASDSGVVHTTGNESISGTKTFSNASIWATSSPSMGFRHTSLNGIVNAPSATMSWVLSFTDKNDAQFGRLRCEFLPDGSRSMRVGVFNASGAISQLIAGYDEDGVAYATAPNTSASRTFSGDVITRGYLNGSNSGVVHTSGNETVGGTKTFSASIVSSYASPAFAFSNNTSAVNFCGGTSTSYNTGAKLILYGGSSTATPGNFDCSTGGSSRRSLIGNPNGTLTWNGQTVQTSSDERVKDFISSVPDGDLDSWGAVEWVRFKYRADVEAKGADACRWHTGLVSQHVERACASGPMDVLSYGMLCLDSVENEDTGKRDELWMVRYAEALCMEAAYMRRENARLKKRVADLEDRLATLELRLGSE